MSQSVSIQNGLRTYRPSIDNFIFNTPDLEKRVMTWREGVLAGMSSRALLLSGEAGLGKTSLALALCDALGADSRDIQQINCANTRTLEDARDLLNRIAYSPSFGEYRVLILDEVQQMVQNAQQAFLTPIESLPTKTLLIACTSAPETLNVAFRSRFYEVRLEPYSEDSLQEILEKLPAPPKPAQIATIIKLACGNARRAIALAEGGISPGDQETLKKLQAIDSFYPLLMAGDYPSLLFIINQLSDQDRRTLFQKTLTLLEGTWLKLQGKPSLLMMQDERVVTTRIAQGTLNVDLVARLYWDLSCLRDKPLESLKAWIMTITTGKYPPLRL